MSLLCMTLICIGTFAGFSFTNVNGYGLIQNVESGSCLSNANGGLADMERITLAPCDSSSVDQEWNVLGLVDHNVVPGLIIGRNGKCLDGSNGIPESYTYMYTCTGDAKNQLWRMINGDFASTFQLQSTLSTKCLVNDGGVATANVECLDGDKSQTWKVKSSKLLSTCSSMLNPFKRFG